MYNILTNFLQGGCYDRYFDHMYYGRETGVQMSDLKTTAFAEQG